MEENKDKNLDQEETKAEYTGEYGNSVEGEYKAPEAPSAEHTQNAQPTADSSSQPHGESSLYSYNYQNGNGESTHSGDYYGNRNSNPQDNNTAASSSGQDGTRNSQGSETTGSGSYNAGTSGSNYNSQSTGTSGSGYNSQSTGTSGSGYNSTGTSSGGYNSQSTGTSGSNYNNQNAGNTYGSQNQFYQNTNPYQNGGNNQAQNNENRKPQKNGSSLGMKILVTAVCAVLFGVIAGTCFQAVNFVTERIIGTSQVEQIDKTTTNNDSQQQLQNNTSSNTGKTIINNTITDVSAITEQTMPALVAITSTTKGTDYYDLFGQYYPGQDATSCGTGIIVGQNDKELLIATNNHVIDGAKTISIQFIDGEIYEATEKGSDSSNDLAVVAVKVSDVKKDTMSQIKIADLGNSDEAKVGQMVIAIGNALGYGQSITVGYISAKDREITEASENGRPANKIKAIQTDAAINPGNSGGALINMQGQVIGINSAKIADSTVEGVGYAIPISVATPIIDDLMNREILEDSEKGYLGISGSTVSEAASAYNIPYGVHVKEVAKGGAAEKGGIMANDIITAVNKMEVTTIESLQEKVNSYRKGTEVEITVQRSSNGKYEEKILKVTLQGSESLDNLDDTTDNNGNSGNNNGNNGGNGNGGNNYGNGNNDYGNGGNDYGNGGSGSIWDYFFN